MAVAASVPTRCRCRCGWALAAPSPVSARYTCASPRLSALRLLGREGSGRASSSSMMAAIA
eukprot:scaffold15879_cov66-Phaeocystis_antarctica.AAC.6